LQKNEPALFRKHDDSFQADYRTDFVKYLFIYVCVCNDVFPLYENTKGVFNNDWRGRFPTKRLVYFLTIGYFLRKGKEYQVTNGRVSSHHFGWKIGIFTKED
jgi:hypothetical protein